MKKIFNKLETSFERLISKGSEQVDKWLYKDKHHIVITGLSRSGKTMFFTALMSLFGQRVNQTTDQLPLLKSLPKDLVESFELRPIQGETIFPLNDCLTQLQKGEWPSSTDQIYGFELVIKLRQTHLLKKWVSATNEVVFCFYDYPGEWLTDLPMLNKSYIDWSNAAWSQQLNPPQKFYAQDWQDFVSAYNFDLSPSPERIKAYTESYRLFLNLAKQNGITLLQPGSMLMESHIFDWQHHGFAPLPTAISSDPEHPWTQVFNANYEDFKQSWLKPLQENYFAKADKQILLLDLHEGLSHSRAHLSQLKETISNLSNSFVYGADKWYKPKILFGEQVSKVAFVASKVDLIPAAEQASFMSLLQDVTAGVRAHLKDQEVEFQHFLISALQVTDKGEAPNSLRFTDQNNQYQEWFFDPLPKTLKDLNDQQAYPAIHSAVPEDVLARMNYAQGIDRLIEYLIKA